MRGFNKRLRAIETLLAGGVGPTDWVAIEHSFNVDFAGPSGSVELLASATVDDVYSGVSSYYDDSAPLPFEIIFDGGEVKLPDGFYLANYSVRVHDETLDPIKFRVSGSTGYSVADEGRLVRGQNDLIARFSGYGLVKNPDFYALSVWMQNLEATPRPDVTGTVVVTLAKLS